MRTTWTSMGTWQPPIPSLCTFLALPWCDDFSIRNSSRDWGRHTHGFHLPSDFANWKTLEQSYHQIATVFRFSFEQDHLSLFHKPSLPSLATSKLMEPCLPKRTWFILNGFNFWWILRLLVLVLHEASWYDYQRFPMSMDTSGSYFIEGEGPNMVMLGCSASRCTTSLSLIPIP